MIIIILSISLFESNKVNPFAALTSFTVAPHSQIFLSKLFITDKVVLVANRGKIYLAKGTANVSSASLPY